MRFGILADIHGCVEYLQRAIVKLNRERVDQFVVLGDLICDRSNADETVALLRGCDAMGVWGNHELGLCVEPDDDICEMYSQPVLEYFGQLKAHVEHDDILFSHTLPHEDATDPMAYYVGEQSLSKAELDKTFGYCRHRVIVIGHFHRWFSATPVGQTAWDGRKSLRLAVDDRYLLVIGAVMHGWAAMFDQESNELTPIRLS
jgi:predicted phosphodiesterase